jgi:hypothetical protein
VKSLHDAWTLHRDNNPNPVLDARARFEIERAFYAGAEFAVDTVQDMHAAGLALPPAISNQLQLWSSEAHAARYSRKGRA